MLCRSDHMESTEFEKESQLVAGLILYVNRCLGRISPTWVKECAENCYGATRANIQHGDERLVPLLCATLKGLNETQKEYIIYNAKNKESRALADWWENHQESDKRREREERNKKKQKELVKSALAKLTPEERRALGR